MTSFGPNGFGSELDKAFRDAHEKSDVDFEPGSQHHTLGDSVQQAARGNHKHDGLYQKLYNYYKNFAQDFEDLPPPVIVNSVDPWPPSEDGLLIWETDTGHFFIGNGVDFQRIGDPGQGFSKSLRGRAVSSHVASITGSVDILYPTGFFDVEPDVQLTVIHSTFYFPSYDNESITGFTAFTKRFTNVAVTADVDVSWIAVQ